MAFCPHSAAQNHDGYELQKHPQAHQLVGIGPTKITPPEQGKNAYAQGDQNGDQGYWDEDVEQNMHA